MASVEVSFQSLMASAMAAARQRPAPVLGRRGGRNLNGYDCIHALSGSDHSTQLRKAVIASVIGGAIEWYDFFIYGIAAGLIFGKLYFQNEEPLTATARPRATEVLPPIVQFVVPRTVDDQRARGSHIWQSGGAVPPDCGQ
jgi:hypothetical protein